MGSRVRWNVLAPILMALVGGGAMLAALLAAVIAWWMLTDPALVAIALDARDLTPLVAAIARTVLDALLARRR